MTLDLSWIMVIAVSLGGLTIAYGLGCAILAHRQTALVFRPEFEIKQTPADYGLNYREVWVPIGLLSGQSHACNPATTHEKLHAWWIGETQPQQADRVLIYFHGNRGNIGSTLNLKRIAAFYHTWGGSVLIADYRGFGRSVMGPPSEAKLYEDLDAIWTYVTQDTGISPHNIAVYGHSLGGAAAIEFARRHASIAALIVDGSFTSIYDVARENPSFRPFPLDRILKHRFESIAKVPALTMPKLFIHGTADDVVPPLMSEKLYAAAAEPKELCLLPQVAHEDVLELAGEQFLQVLSQFLNDADPSQSKC